MLNNVEEALAARQASEVKVRQFVADASHELRNPLAAIRGYAELTRRDGDELPEDAAYAMARVESEADRMSHLVEDLLLLARLDSGPIWTSPHRPDRDADQRGQRRAGPPGPTTPGRSSLPDEPVMCRRRPSPAAPGGGQPARQRAYPHAGRALGWRLGGRSPTAKR